MKGSYLESYERMSVVAGVRFSVAAWSDPVGTAPACRKKELSTLRLKRRSLAKRTSLLSSTRARVVPACTIPLHRNLKSSCYGIRITSDVQLNSKPSSSTQIHRISYMHQPRNSRISRRSEANLRF